MGSDRTEAETETETEYNRAEPNRAQPIRTDSNPTDHKHMHRTSDSLVHANGALKFHVAPRDALHLPRGEKASHTKGIAEKRYGR